MAKKESRSPFPVQRLSQQVDQLFDELIHRPRGCGHASSEAWSPQLDLYETHAAFILEVDLPGVRRHEVSVTVEEGNLVLQGRRSFVHAATAGKFYCHERRAGHFARRLRLPTSVDQEQVRAEFHNGVLRVTLPKLTTERHERT